MEIIDGMERRRRWRAEDKLRIVAEVEAPGACFAEVARRHDVSTAEHPRRHLASYSGILQADAHAGFGDLYLASRKPGPVTEAACRAYSGARCSS